MSNSAFDVNAAKRAARQAEYEATQSAANQALPRMAASASQVQAYHGEPVAMRALEGIGFQLDSLEAIMRTSASRLSHTAGRIFCLPVASESQASGQPPAEQASLPNIAERIRRIYDIACAIDVEATRLDEQL